MRLIDADKLEKQLDNEKWMDNYDRDFIVDVALDEAPTVDAVPVVRGEWIVDECDTPDDVPSYSWIDFHCSECNTDYGLEEGQYGWCRYEKIPYNYCPSCGAHMIGGENDE